MKTLELNQMEEITAANMCAAASILGSVGTYGSILFAVGPIGWGLAAISLASLAVTAYECDGHNH